MIGNLAERPAANFQPTVRRGLHRTAAEWFRDSGKPLTALEHAVAARHNQLIHEFYVDHPEATNQALVQ